MTVSPNFLRPVTISPVSQIAKKLPIPTVGQCNQFFHQIISCLSLSSIRPSIGTENPIPEEMDYREIAVRVPVMNEVQFLFPPEPCKPLKPRSLYVVFLVEKDVRVKRRAHATSQKAARVLS